MIPRLHTLHRVQKGEQSQKQLVGDRDLLKVSK